MRNRSSEIVSGSPLRQPFHATQTFDMGRRAPSEGSPLRQSNGNMPTFRDRSVQKSQPKSRASPLRNQPARSRSSNIRGQSPPTSILKNSPLRNKSPLRRSVSPPFVAAQAPMIMDSMDVHVLRQQNKDLQSRLNSLNLQY